MFELMAMQTEHLQAVISEPMNQHLSDWPFKKMALLCQHPYSFTGLVKNDIVICGGLVELWANRAFLWTVLSQNYEKHPVVTFRGMKTFLDIQPYNRVEMDVPVDMEKAHRRARMLGFQLECRIAKKFSENGEDRSLYAWVREQ